MGITADGNSITIDNCTVTINNAFDPTTGTATITFTPSGGLGTLPALLDGQPGPPPILRNIYTTSVPFGQTAPAPSFTPISPGGPGTPSVYDMNIAVTAGEPGTTGNFLIQDAKDFLGSLVNGAVLVWNTVDNAFNLQLPMMSTYTWPSVVNSTSGSGPGPRTLASVTIPAQTFAYYPIVSGQTLVSGTVNTQVNVAACIGTTGGPQVGSGFGVAGQPTQVITLSSGPPAGSSATYGQVAANTSATILFTATQVGANQDSWSTSESTTLFSVSSQPVPLF